MFALSGHKSTEDSTEPGCPKRASRQNMHIGHRDIILLKQSFWASRPRWSEGSGPYSGYGLQKLVFEHGEIAGARMAILKSRGIRMEDHFHVIPSWFGIPLVVCDIPYVSEQVLKTEQGIAVAEEKLAWGIEKKVVIYIMRPDEGNASEKGDETAYHKMEENETLITDKNSSCQVGDVEEVDVVPKTLLDKLSRTQRGMLFVAASRCTSQLVIILP
ncbi:hypothetical protein BaRGS_00012278 [Batillaria attramentaria]|uniref:Uncharacterized protein n=1 Tax=Batillaria attramentaria TaxID=370345 RepID=A0ABD0LAQ6_9CAEN